MDKVRGQIWPNLINSGPNSISNRTLSTNESIPGDEKHSKHDDEYGIGDEAVEGEREEDDNVVGLEVLEVSDDTLAQPSRGSRPLKVGRLEKVRPGANDLSLFRDPHSDGGVGHLDVGLHFGWDGWLNFLGLGCLVFLLRQRRGL